MITSLSETIRTARKTHQCQMCGEAINAGEKYLDQRNCDGDSVWIYKAHERCDRLLHAYCKWAGMDHMYWDDELIIDHGEFRRFLSDRIEADRD